MTIHLQLASNLKMNGFIPLLPPTHLHGVYVQWCKFRCVYKILMGKPEGKRLLGRSRRRWEDNIRMNLQEVGCGGVDWM